MATFTFTRGNAQGLRRIPLYLLGALVTLLVPRTDRIWVFGSGIGPGEGALPLLRLARARLDPQVRLVWVATTERELAIAQRLRLDAVAKLSVRGFWLTARARVLVVTHGQGDVNRYGARGGFLVQLWHGIPLKKLHLDSPAALESSLLGSRRLGRAVITRALRAVGRQISLFPVSSGRIADRIVSAFGVRPENVVVVGDPRDDVLLQGEPEQRRMRARAEIAAAVGSIAESSRVVMYAPTWREGDPDPAAPSHGEWPAIVDWLARVDAVFIVRSHPLGHGDYATGPALSDRVRLLDATMIADLTPILPGVDHLVTDYSSVAYDFALTGGSTVFLASDVLTYASTRGLYEPYQSFSGGHDVAGWPEAIARLDALAAGDPLTSAACDEQRLRMLHEHFDHPDGHATERVLEEILHRTAGLTAASTAVPRIRPVVNGIELDDKSLRITLTSSSMTVRASHLDGPREIVDGVIVDGADDTLTITFPLVVSRWGGPGLALPSGDYRLVLRDAVLGIETTRIQVATPELAPVLTPLFRGSAVMDEGGLVLRVEPPLTDSERRPATQRLFRWRTLFSRGADEDAVWFETFYGKSTGDNPGALDRLIARDHPGIRRYWSVTDLSVPVPAGAVPVVEFSEQWWRARAHSRVLVINDWLRWSHRPRRGQKVLQTWHGTMLKRLALDRSHRTARARLATRRQSYWWDAMLAQNDYSAANFRTSYAFDGPIWVTGYPRNDPLHDEQRGEQVRAVLGLDNAARTVLYVPTWRDDRDDLVDHLDLVAFADALPAGTVLLVRGHSRTLGHGRDLRAAGLVDVTSYPDVADLLLVADILVTDYSSVMFDFAATGKPMVFFTPDIDHYADVLRGFYFDLLAVAPGPVVQTSDSLLTAIANIDAASRAYAGRYRTWQETFAPHDDGHATERVLQRLVDEGWLGSAGA